MANFIHSQVADINPSFDVPLALYRNVLAARPVGHLDRPSTLVQLAVVHFARFEKRRDGVDAAHAQTMLHEVTTLGSAESHENRAATFLLQLQAERDVGTAQGGGQSDVVRDSASGLTGEDLWTASVRLVDLFERFGDLADLQQAISLLEEAVRSTSVWDYRHLMGLTNLGATFAHRFQRLGELSDLEQAISKHRDAVGLTPDGHPDIPTRLCHLGGTLLLRFQRLGEFSDLEEAISILKHAVDLSPVGHPACLNHLGISLLSRFERLGELSDLAEAISRLKDAVHLTYDGHPYRPTCLNNLGNSIFTRFQRFGDLSDLELAISNHRDAADLTPDGHPRKPGHLSGLGCLLLCRFERLGDLSDLDQAIFRFGDAVDLTPDGHLSKPGRLNNLGSSFSSRFQHLGELNDLEQAIFRFEGALDLIPDGHPDKHRPLSNLGVTFQYRFERLEELGDLEQAISRLRDAACLTPDGHPDKPVSLSNLGNSFRTRFAHLGELSDLEQAISTLRNAIDLTPTGHPSTPGCLNNLGNSFLARFQLLGELSDLDQTISRYGDAVNLTPDGDPGKPRLLSNLGSAFLYRFERLGELVDLEQAMSSYSHAACASSGPTTVRFQASQEWISCARTLRHHSLLHAYSFAIGLLPELAWIGLSLTDRYRVLMQGTDVVREAAAAALNAGRPETAVEWLEEGRSIVWGELFQLRNSYEDLSSAHPEHARRLRELSAALEHASATREKSLSLLLEQTQSADHRATVSSEKKADKHRTLAIERDKLLQEIRGLPGFKRFLLRKEFSQLRASAHSGPVVILNAAKTRCDALIVLAELDHVLHVPLPDFTLKRSKGLQNMLRSLLGPARVIPDDERVGRPATQGCISWESVLYSLWNGMVKPVLDALDFSVCDVTLLESTADSFIYVSEQTPGDLSRIFWCPTGPFTFLPIHAAGLYGTQSSEPGQKLSDFVVSSYVPTLSILAPHAPKPDAVSGGGLRLLTVRQPPSDGQSRLPGVDTELEYIRTVVQNSSSARTTLMESSVGTVEDVLTLMKDAEWVHFACHGIQDAANPIDSGLCLADQRRLKLSDIISVSRPRGGLAFLSACQTAMGHKDLSDEAIHIAAGMLFAGYGGVVGTMWSISDRLAPLVAKDVYEQLFRNGTTPDYREAARALHDAVGRLRNSNASFVEWLPFIHVGL
jgi:tetratricopeptide (TPR) repeat protein